MPVIAHLVPSVPRVDSPDNDGVPPEYAALNTCGPSGNEPCDRIYNNVDPQLLADVLGVDESVAEGMLGTFTCGPNGDALCTSPNRTWIRERDSAGVGPVFGTFGCGPNGDQPCGSSTGGGGGGNTGPTVYACGPSGNEACPPGFDPSATMIPVSYASYSYDGDPSSGVSYTRPPGGDDDVAEAEDPVGAAEGPDGIREQRMEMQLSMR